MNESYDSGFDDGCRDYNCKSSKDPLTYGANYLDGYDDGWAEAERHALAAAKARLGAR